MALNVFIRFKMHWAQKRMPTCILYFCSSSPCYQNKLLFFLEESPDFSGEIDNCYFKFLASLSLPLSNKSLSSFYSTEQCSVDTLCINFILIKVIHNTCTIIEFDHFICINFLFWNFRYIACTLYSP